MKKQYIRPEYENNNQLENIILASIEVSEEDGGTIIGTIDIEDIFSI